MLEGICPKCGLYRRGWALAFPRHQFCSECGTALLTTENGQPVSQGYSPFSDDGHTIYQREDSPLPDENKASQN